MNKIKIVKIVGLIASVAGMIASEWVNSRETKEEIKKQLENK